MKIVLLNDDALPTGRGGTAVVVERLRQSYAKKGHNVTLITTHQEEPDQILRRKDDHGEILSVYRNYDLRKRHSACLFDQKMHDTLDRLFEELKPDAVHAHNLHTYLTYDALRVAKKYTNHILLTANDVFLVAFNRVNSQKYFSSVRDNKPYKMHAYEHLFAVGRKYNPRRNAAIRDVLKETGTKVIAVSTALKKFLETNGVDVYGVVHNGADTEISSITDVGKRYGITKKTILFGGRISTDKGVPELLKAFEEVLKKEPTAQLLVVGDASPEAMMPYLENPETVKQIICTGWVDQNTLRALFSACTVVTTPSMCLDTFNLMNVEGMLAAKPVVGSCFGGAPEIIQHGITGFVIDPRDTRVFSDVLQDLLTNEARAVQMGEVGKKRAEQEFSVRKQADKYLELLAK